jgi:hypothetical protein
MLLRTCLLASALLLPALGPATASVRTMRVTFVGDSVPASILSTTPARVAFDRGYAARLDLRVCRRLVAPSCSYMGATPPTALQAVRSYGRRLGDVLVVDVGYNDDVTGYGAGIDRIVRSALAQGARGVVWVTLRDTTPDYHLINGAIAAAARRWPELIVADWNRRASEQPWFSGDGLHLTPRGAEGLVGFLRPYVARAAQLPLSRTSAGR